MAGRLREAAVLVNGLVPLALLGWDAAHGDLGANPVEFVLRSTGTLALVFLALTLAITPARKLLRGALAHQATGACSGSGLVLSTPA